MGGEGGHTAPDRSRREAYVHEVWTAFCQAAGKPNGAKPADTEKQLAASWHQEGVPLRIVLRAIQDSVSNARREARSLLYLVDPVKDAVEYWRKAVPSPDPADLQRTGDQQEDFDLPTTLDAGPERPPPREPT